MAQTDFLRPRPDTPVVVHPATGEVLPIVCDSPHSGTSYPADFGHAVPMSLLRRGEDTHVAALWDRWPAHGATLIEATFPRTYIDPNRSEADLDPAQIDGQWPVPLAPSVKTRQGLGAPVARDAVLHLGHRARAFIQRRGHAVPADALPDQAQASTASRATGVPTMRRWRRPSMTACSALAASGT